MKSVTVTLLTLVALVNSDDGVTMEDEEVTAYGYHTKIGIPLANEIREAEAQPQSRLAGGSSASLGQFPYQVGIVIDIPKSQSVCGGSILNPQSVLTAAHCWYDGRNQGSSLTVVAGSVTLFSGGQRIPSKNVVMHENWNSRKILYDIAIIKLYDTPLSFNSNVGPITLATGSDTFAGRDATISGFGRTGAGPVTKSQRLSFLKMTVITNDECKDSTPIYKSYVHPNNICAKPGKDQSTCGGDSGSPLTVGSGDTLEQVGINSFGSSPRCPRDTPTVFTRVSSYAQWIQDHL